MTEPHGWAQPAGAEVRRPAAAGAHRASFGSAGAGPASSGPVALRPLALGEILDGGFAVVRRHPRAVFGVAFVLAAVAALVKIAVGWAISDIPSTAGLSTLSTDDDGNAVLTTTDVAGRLLSATVDEIFGLVLAGLVAVVVGKAVLGHGVDGREAGRETRARWVSLAVASLVAGGLPWLPFAAMYAIGLLGLIPAVILGGYLWTKLALCVPALMLERVSVRVAITRSWRLTRGAFWRTWGLRALATVAARFGAVFLAIPFAIPAIIAASDHDQPSGLASVLGGVGSGLVWTLTAPIVAAALTLIYVDRRMRAEALDISFRLAGISGGTNRATAEAVSLMKP